MNRARTTKAHSSHAQALVDASCCVAEVMGTDLFTVTPDTVVGSALRLATARHIHHIFVIEGGNLTGIVCETDLKQARVSSLVSACMKSPVLCIGPETTVSEAADIMKENEVGCLPVVTGAFLVGMVTRDRISDITDDGQTEVEDDFAAAADDSKDRHREPAPCAACGSPKNVKRNAAAGFVELCADCSGVIPAIDPVRGN